MKQFRVGILGATGMVGQQFVHLLSNHPWFEITVLAASPTSAGKSYNDAVKNKWKLEETIPKSMETMLVQSVTDDIDQIIRHVDFVFCALDMEKKEIVAIEEHYAAKNIPVISNNSANRWTEDVPMIIPEINPDHIDLITKQRKIRGWKHGCIVVKPNCSIQSYVAVLTALKKYNPQTVRVTSMQAISGAGQTFHTWPDMADNLIPYIGGEEEKSEREPMKIWGDVVRNSIRPATTPHISATCIRVPVSNGHMASVAVSFEKKPTREEIITAVTTYSNPIASFQLPSAPKQFITFYDEPTRPQTRSDRELERGMGISMGRLREDGIFDYSFVSLSHNTIRGAAGGAILTAELLAYKKLL